MNLEQLKQLIADKKEQRKSLVDSMINGETIEERKASQNAIANLDKEIETLETLARSMEKGANFDPMATYGMDTRNETSSAEYRKAFMEYATSGKVNKILKRAGASGTSEDLGILVPSTVIQKVMTGLKGVYGHLYARVHKTNLPGGVKYPIGSFSATFKRIGEGAVSERQKAGGVTGYVSFGYNIGEIRVARSLLQVVLSVDAWEDEFAKVIVEAYVKGMDEEILTGSADANQCEGILTEANKSESRINKDTHIIDFTAEEMADWTSFYKKLFAKIPLAMRKERPEFAMTSETWEANILTLRDENKNPVASVTLNAETGDEICKLRGREVVLVEEGGLKSFDSAANGEYFGLYWIPSKAYAINTNLEFYIDHYFDKETNQYVDKAVVINDGKVLDGEYVYLLRKKVSA